MRDSLGRLCVPVALALGIVAGIGTFGSAFAAAGSPRAKEAPVDPAERYHACIATADTNPTAAEAEARAWLKDGGGEAAKLCAAAADLALGRAKQAAETFELLAAAPGSPHRTAAFLAQAADAWIQAGSPDRAVAVLTEALESKPDDPAMLVERARALVDLGRFSDAADDLTRAIDADALSQEAYVLRASALRRAGRLDEAAVDLDTVLMLDRNNPDALLERGLLRRAAGDTSGAHDDWERVVKIAPGSAAAQLAQRHLTRGEGG